MTKIFKKIKIADIEIGNRKRKTSDLTSLIDSIKDVGLLNPITVNQDMMLIAGLHRLEAYKKLGKTEIPAIIIDIDELKAELMEIDENFIRNDLTELEKCEQMKRRKEIYEQLHPEATAKAIKQANLPKRNGCVSDKTEHKVKSFVEDTEEKTGMSKRSIQSTVKIANDITDETKEKIKGTPLEKKKTDLMKVAQTEPEKQKEAVEKINKEITNKKSKKAKETNVSKTAEKSKEPIQLKLLAISYKIDFVKRVVAVNNEWLELPTEYDMDNNSYNNMVAVAKNYKNNKDKSARLQ